MKTRRENRYNETAKKRESIKYIRTCKPTIADDNRFLVELAKVKKQKMLDHALGVIF